MPVYEYDIRAEAGAHWRRNFNWVDNTALATATAVLTVRAEFGGEALIILSETSGITLTAENVYIEFTPAQIAMVRDGLTVAQGPFLIGVYDLRLTYEDGTQQIFLAGKFIVRKSVSSQ